MCVSKKVGKKGIYFPNIAENVRVTAEIRFFFLFCANILAGFLTQILRKTYKVGGGQRICGGLQPRKKSISQYFCAVKVKNNFYIKSKLDCLMSGAFSSSFILVCQTILLTTCFFSPTLALYRFRQVLKKISSAGLKRHASGFITLIFVSNG